MQNDMGGNELHLDFTAEFRAKNIAQQTDAFQQYIRDLINDISRLDPNDPNRQGMLTILQVVEQLMPHIEANEIPLEETIVISLQQDNPFGTITLQS
ncbi:MAG: transcriptional regulator [Gammaproteobacteria bacterium]|nr:transcriptional regulator [Gammaproteobacteria bacterium]